MIAGRKTTMFAMTLTTTSAQPKIELARFAVSTPYSEWTRARATDPMPMNRSEPVVSTMTTSTFVKKSVFGSDSPTT